MLFICCYHGLAFKGDQLCHAACNAGTTDVLDGIISQTFGSNCFILMRILSRVTTASH